jgi:hypothetical protein
VRARVRVDAPLEAVWATLTDYERLADFIPGLAECRLLDQAQGFARLYQVRPALPVSLRFTPCLPVPSSAQNFQSLVAEGIPCQSRCNQHNN